MLDAKSLDRVLSVIAAWLLRKDPLSIAKDGPVLGVGKRATLFYELQSVLGLLRKVGRIDLADLLRPAGTGFTLSERVGTAVESLYGKNVNA